MEEIWKDIKGYEGLYQVSNLGRVKSLRHNKILSLHKNHYGYLAIELYKNNKGKKFRVHRLVAFAFIYKADYNTVVNHRDGNKLNNNVDNLEWTTIADNNRHAVENGLNDCGVKVALYIKGKEVARFKSLADAGRYLGVGRNTIYYQIHTCKHQKKKTKNIKWVLL